MSHFISLWLVLEADSDSRGDLVVRAIVVDVATLLLRAGPGKPQIAGQCILGKIVTLEMTRVV